MPRLTSNSGDTVVAVSPGGALAARPRLFAALEAAFPITFGPVSAVFSPSAIIEFVERGAQGSGPEAVNDRVPKIVFDGEMLAGGGVDDVRMLARSAVDRRLRGVTLAGQLPGAALRPRGRADEVLAEDSSAARWTLSRGAAEVHRIGGALPELSPTTILRDALMSGHSLSVVALTHFLRALCAEDDFRAPPLRATIVFDDPNVRWRSYGYIDYYRLVEHADAHGYHAIMAMIPIDAVGAHPGTVSLFATRADRLSLVFHGNSHVKDELLVPSGRGAALSLCAQALRRVAKFEARTGLSVDRVMTPPHGMCSESVTSALAALGFDALCAIHPVPWSECPPGERYLAGWEPGTFAGPSAVIPRFPLHCSQTEIALRAFMDHPVVLYGHHQDVASGLDLLEQAAARVNALGDVQWMSLSDIARSNVGVRAHGDTVLVRPYSGRVRVRMPREARTLLVEEPRDSDGDLAGWSAGSNTQFGFGAPVSCPGRGEVEIRLRPHVEIDPNSLSPPTWRVWPMARRAATETRDRVMSLRLARRA
jgi:hypothetical protein